MSVVFPRGFVASGAASGIKPDGRLDLSFTGFAGSARGAGAAVFTQSLSAAAPVAVSREHLAATRGRLRGVIASSGNANALNGEPGMESARAMAAMAAREFGGAPEEYLVMATGLIGIPFPLATALSGGSALRAAAASSEEAGLLAARAIMTTDTHPKLAIREGDGWRIGGMAKGAAMIAPNMATMLSVITTDALLAPEEASAVLAAAVSSSFNRITIDGCTSTNDTVILLASGLAGAPGPGFEAALAEVAGSLAYQIVADAEGGSRVGRIVVTGAPGDAEADAIARRVANSLLVKCSLLGADPYWGRVLGEVGLAGVALDPAAVDISYQGIKVARGGLEARGELDPGTLSLLSERMQEHDIEVLIEINQGGGSATMLTSDIGHGYLEENRGTS